MNLIYNRFVNNKTVMILHIEMFHVCTVYTIHIYYVRSVVNMSATENDVSQFK